MQKNVNKLDDLIKLKTQLDVSYTFFVREMEYAINQVFTEVYPSIIIRLVNDQEVFKSVNQQFTGVEIHDKIAFALKYLFQRYSNRIMSESLDQMFEKAFVKAKDRHEQPFLKRLAANPNAFLSVYNPHSRFSFHPN